MANETIDWRAAVERISATANTDDVLALIVVLEVAADRMEALEAENARLREAITPSADTKAAYIGEFEFETVVNVYDEETEEWEPQQQAVLVPWTTIKEVMAAIAARAALNGTGANNGKKA